MIKHIVMWKLKETSEGCTKEENAKKIKSLLENLKDKISEIKYLEVGINVNSSESAFDAVLISEFETLEDLNSYQVNPEHKKVSAFVKSVRLDRKVVDYIF
ncbi:MAG: Dabb family protein [Bacillota bacterium]|nr:Dabb family protein [Bacillota bacterium]